MQQSVSIKPINISWLTTDGRREGIAIAKKPSEKNPIMTLYFCYFNGDPKSAVWISEANLEF